jgi:ABC-2 type transport system permease protein
MFPLMGFAIQTSMEAAEETLGNLALGVLNWDHGAGADNLTAFLTALDVPTLDVDEQDLTAAITTVAQSNLTGLIVIPPGFSQNLTETRKATLEVYAVFRGGGLAESATFSAISTLLQAFEASLVVQKIAQEIPDEDPATVLDPIDMSERSIIGGKGVDVHPEVLFGFMMSQSTGMPIGIMMLLIFAMQLAATSVASEKEEKTLETLLTMPVSRFTILAGKLTGSILVAVVGAIAYIVGFSYYTSSLTGFMPAAGVDLATLGLAPTPLSLLLLGISLFMSLLSALALAISISIFAEDVRGAQALVGPLSVIMVFPMIFTMFTNIYTLPFPLMIILLAIPFTHPMLAANAAFTGNYLTAILGIVYVTGFTLLVLYIAARLFGTEKILTAKLKFGRFRLRRPKT